jgi:hypothetical protein
MYEANIHALNGFRNLNSFFLLLWRVLSTNRSLHARDSMLFKLILVSLQAATDTGHRVKV